MIVDSSAILAALLDEDDADVYRQAIAASETIIKVGALNWLECYMVLSGRGGELLLKEFDQFCAESQLVVVSVSEQHLPFAAEAYRRFGKGRHPARLNRGDCFAYALAKATGEPLLFKGDGFSQTDILPALPPPA